MMRAEKHETESREHVPNLFRLYMFVAVALIICTALSFVFNYYASEDVHTIAKTTAFLLILGVASLKALLVGYIFMHLKWDWGKLYFLIIPVAILGMMMIIVLLPDALLGVLYDAKDQLIIAEQFAKEMKK